MLPNLEMGLVCSSIYEWVNVGRANAHCLTSNIGFVFASDVFLACLTDRRFEFFLGVKLQSLFLVRDCP